MNEMYLYTVITSFTWRLLTAKACTHIQERSLVLLRNFLVKTRKPSLYNEMLNCFYFDEMNFMSRCNEKPLLGYACLMTSHDYDT